jgi:Phage Tail Protein X
MAAQYLKHITIAGERWDLLGWQYYGDATDYSGIVMANPQVPIEAAFEAGLTLLIPIVQAAAVAPADLPPWGTA